MIAIIVAFVLIVGYCDCAQHKVAHSVLVHPGKGPTSDPLEQEQDIVGFERTGYRNADADPNVLWDGGRIPFKFAKSLSSSAKDAIKDAMKDYEKYTCLKWEPATSGDRNYIEFYKGDGCWSYVGQDGGKQQLSIGRGCEYKGIAIHEMMHSIGFYHEQSRSDRDEYVKVQYENIKRGYGSQFEKLDKSEENQLGEPYDYNSVMHYDRKSFTKSYRLDTIVPKEPGAEIGQRKAFSSRDLLKINKLYRCPDSYNQRIESLVAQATSMDTETVDDDQPADVQVVKTTPKRTITTTTRSPKCIDFYSKSYCYRRRNRGCRRSSRTRQRCQKTCRQC